MIITRTSFFTKLSLFMLLSVSFNHIACGERKALFLAIGTCALLAYTKKNIQYQASIPTLTPQHAYTDSHVLAARMEKSREQRNIEQDIYEIELLREKIKSRTATLGDRFRLLKFNLGLS